MELMVGSFNWTPPEVPNQSGISIFIYAYDHASNIQGTSISNLTLERQVPVDILFNGGFEDGTTLPTLWSEDSWTASFGTLSWDSTEKYSGNKSVKIVNTTANDARWIQTVNIQPNSDYLLSGWIKTENVSHTQDTVDAGANLSVMGGFEYTTGLFATNDWTYVSLTFNTGSRSQIDIGARVGMYSGTSAGTAWFDDLKLELLDTPLCYTLSTNTNPINSGNIVVDPAPNCNNGLEYVHGTIVKLTPNNNTNYHFNNWSGDISESSNPLYIHMTDSKSVIANFSQNATQNPQWKILVLIYTSTDFTYNDSSGQHHVEASMTQNEIDRATAAANQFIDTDIPVLTSGNMIPLLTIRLPNQPLSTLDETCGYWPNRANTSPDLDPSFDSVIVIWDDSGIDLLTGQPADLIPVAVLLYQMGQVRRIQHFLWIPFLPINVTFSNTNGVIRSCFTLMP